MTVSAPIEEAAPARLVRHWRALWPLAWPVVLNRAGLVVMQMVGIVMVGRHSTEALAAFSIGSAIAAPLMVAGFGCVVGIVALSARAFGARDPDLPGNALRGLAWAVLIGVIATGLTFFAGPVLRLVGQAPELVRGGTLVAWMLAPGVLAQIVFSAACFYLEGTARPQPGLYAMAAANVLNIALTWLLIGGHLGAPEMGAAGAALASTVARFLMAALFVVWLLRLTEFDGHRAAHGVWGPGGWAAGAEMRRIGLAGGAAYFFETVAFASLAQAAGLLGATALAAYTIVHNVETTVFMLGLGISVATAVRVGHAAGAGLRDEARIAGIAGIVASMGLLAALGILLVAFAPTVVGFYSADPALIARATPLIAILAFSMLFDSGQVVLGQANRALGDSWMTTLCFFLAFWCVMIPAALLLAFHAGLAEAGLFIGTAMGCIAAVVLLGLRFRQLLSRI